MTDEQQLEIETAKFAELLRRLGWDSNDPELLAQHQVVHALLKKIQDKRCPPG